MTMTISETTETTTEFVTIEDRAGLEALPTGTELQLDSDHLYVKKHRDGHFTWSRGHLDGLGQITVDQMSSLTATGWLPAKVMNPEILGGFYKPNPFEVGDRVVKTTVEHFIAQGSTDRDYAEGEAPQGATGRVTSVDRIWKGVSLHVEWDHGRGSVISPDNLSFVPQYGDKVRIVKADGAPAGATGTFVPRHQANLADWAGYEDHPFAVESNENGFTYLVQIVEVVERSDLWDWERELLYPEPVVEEAEVEAHEPPFKEGDTVVIKTSRSHVLKWDGFEATVSRDTMGFDSMTYLKPNGLRPDNRGEANFFWDNDELTVVEPEPQPLYKAGDLVTIDYKYDSDSCQWSGPGIVTGDYFEGGYCVNVYSFSRGMTGGFFEESIVEKHDPEEFTIQTFAVGDTVSTEEELDLLPNNSVIVIGDSNGYIARTKVSGRWGWPSDLTDDLDRQDDMTRSQVVSCGATIKHLGSEDIA